jgi:hypothetical protein
MSENRFFERIIIGLKRKPLNFLLNAFIVYTVIWSLIEPLLGFMPSLGNSIPQSLKIFLLISGSIIIGLIRNAIPNEIRIKYDNSIIRIKFGDLFSTEGLKVIPVSRFFLETQVVKTSLQNILIHKFIDSEEYGIGLNLYLQGLGKALGTSHFDYIIRRDDLGREKYYPLGTTAQLKLRNDEYILFALTETEIEEFIEADNCDAKNMWVALEEFWKNARRMSRGRNINIPLLGSGITGIRMNAKQILEFNLLAIVNALEAGGRITTGDISIILYPPKYLEEINLSDFSSMWIS